MVAALGAFDGARAAVAVLIPFFLGDADELLGGWVLRAGWGLVPFGVAGRADFELAFGTFAVFAVGVGASAWVGEVDVGWFYPFPAAAGGTVEAVFGGVFLVFAVPEFLEFVVEELGC